MRFQKGRPDRQMSHEAVATVDLESNVADRRPVPWIAPTVRMGLRECRDLGNEHGIRNCSLRRLISKPDVDVIGRAPYIKLRDVARW